MNLYFVAFLLEQWKWKTNTSLSDYRTVGLQLGYVRPAYLVPVQYILKIILHDVEQTSFEIYVQSHDQEPYMADNIRFWTFK
jgi:hypothetical protein